MTRIILALLVAVLTGCSHKPPVVALSPATGTPIQWAKPSQGVKPVASAVFFKFNVDTLTEAQLNTLKAVALKANQAGKTIVLTGYADTVGSTAYNMALGRRRANNVQLWLTLQGCSVPLSVASYGEVKGIPVFSRKVTIKGL